MSEDISNHSQLELTRRKFKENLLEKIAQVRSESELNQNKINTEKKTTASNQNTRHNHLTASDIKKADDDRIREKNIKKEQFKERNKKVKDSFIQKQLSTTSMVPSTAPDMKDSKTLMISDKSLYDDNHDNIIIKGEGKVDGVDNDDSNNYMYMNDDNDNNDDLHVDDENDDDDDDDENEHDDVDSAYNDDFDIDDDGDDDDNDNHDDDVDVEKEEGDDDEDIDMKIHIHQPLSSITTCISSNNENYKNPELEEEGEEDANRSDDNSDNNVNNNGSEDDMRNKLLLEQERQQKIIRKKHKIKLIEHLKSLSVQKKEQEINDMKLQKRLKKRAQLIKDRIVQEAIERKLMQQEDTRLTERKSQSAENTVDKKESKKVTKISTSHVDAMVKRLYNKDAPDDDSMINSTTNTTPHTHSNTTTTGKISSSSIKKPPAALAASSSSSSSSNLNGANISEVAFLKEYETWKKKHNLDIHTKVFCMTGLYTCVKEELIRRGWYYNNDPESIYFDLKWALKSGDINQESLQSWQVTNHFLKNTSITTKVGLLKSLLSVKWLADINLESFIPRGYNLADILERKAFIDDFRCQKAIGLLKELIYRYEHTISDIDNKNKKSSKYSDNTNIAALTSSSQKVNISTTNDEDDCSNNNNNNCSISIPDNGDENSSNLSSNTSTATAKIKESRSAQTKIANEKPLRVNKAVFDTCKTILLRVLEMTDEGSIDESFNICSRTYAPDREYVLDLEWDIIEANNMYDENGVLPPHFLSTKDDLSRQRHNPTTTNTATTTSSGGGGSSSGNMSNTGYQPTSLTSTAEILKENNRRIKYEKFIREQAVESIKTTISLTTDQFQDIKDLLLRYSQLTTFQDKLNGSGENTHNLWIVKPAAKSRGRGIATFADLKKLLKYIDSGSGCSYQNQWIVQKYMENPLIIAKRKFDFRQWVVVSDWNPLTIYFYNECYARFSVDEYSTNISSLENLYAHLVNNSIGKYSENFDKTVKAENGHEISGYMWSHKEFSEYIQYSTGHDLMTTKIHPQMKEIAKWSLMCASEMVEYRKNSFELYGFDFMVDDEYNAWLIEINSSPACDYSTKTTERYVQKALVELISVIFDYSEWEKESSKKDRGPPPSLGGWECIYKGPYVEAPVAKLGIDLTIKGDAMKTKKIPPIPPYIPPINTKTVTTSGIATAAATSSSSRKMITTSPNRMQHDSSTSTSTSISSLDPNLSSGVHVGENMLNTALTSRSNKMMKNTNGALHSARRLHQAIADSRNRQHYHQSRITGTTHDESIIFADSDTDDDDDDSSSVNYYHNNNNNNSSKGYSVDNMNNTNYPQPPPYHSNNSCNKQVINTKQNNIIIKRPRQGPVSTTAASVKPGHVPIPMKTFEATFL